MIFNRRNKRKKIEIYPDEIFLDSKNIPNFNKQQFEGRLEKSIPKKSIILLYLIFIFSGLVFMGKLGHLQLIKGEAFLKRSESNTLKRDPIISSRGLIYDRNNNLLAWNHWDDNENENKDKTQSRNYIEKPGYSLLLGYVSNPSKDSSGNFWQDKFIGKDGLERYYDDILKGENGVRLVEIDVSGKIHSENIVSPPISGQDLVLSIDSRIQDKMYDSIFNMSQNANFVGGVGMIMNIKNGEIISLVNYPEYDNNILTKGKDSKIINSYLTDKRNLFLNRAISGIYTPGSIVKPFFAYAALEENVISPLKQILSMGSISIPNPYFPGQETVFKDHDSFGYVDMRKAIAVSSDVYFYVIGGGYQDQKGIGILNIDKYSEFFLMNKKTGIDLIGERDGIIPTPEWKAKNFKGEIWRVGDTYNTSIGQYGFQVTPISMAKAVAGIANMGEVLKPHLILNNEEAENDKIILPIDKDKMKIVHEGMLMTSTEGTAKALNVPYVKVASKTGTAQVGFGNTNTNSWVVGFFPYDEPKYSFVVMMERGPKEASGNSTRVMREVLDYMSIYAPEYFK